MEIEKINGYLVVECRLGEQSQILFADNAACALTTLNLEQLLHTNPAHILEKQNIKRIALDILHELWILEGNYQTQHQTVLDQLQHRNTELSEALRACEEENRAKSSFLSNMSHDIRTPMNAIMGMTSIGLSHIDEKPRVLDCLQKIQTASSHLMSLVNDVLDMSRIASGRITLSEEPFSLADMVHDITTIIRPQAAQKHQSFQIEIGKIYAENLIGDPLHLRQILVNIIGNAVKYTQEEGSIYVNFAQRTNNTQHQKIWLDFLCEDNGIGMSPEFLKRIFVPFERVNSSAINKIEGTGLGMSIVKNLLDRMGGEITVESTEGKGSCFRVSIPLTIAPTNQDKYPLPTGQTVLVTASLDSLSQQIISYLKDNKMNVVHLKSGMETVTWLTEAQYENRMPCALLVGQELTDMSSLDMASHVRQLAGKDFPIIMVADADWVKSNIVRPEQVSTALSLVHYFKADFLQFYPN